VDSTDSTPHYTNIKKIILWTSLAGKDEITDELKDETSCRQLILLGLTIFFKFTAVCRISKTKLYETTSKFVDTFARNTAQS
jgi:hypothetical protein